MITARGDRYEVALHASGRRLVEGVITPARDAPVGSQCQRVPVTHTNHGVCPRAPNAPFLNSCDSPRPVHGDEPVEPYGDGFVLQAQQQVYVLLCDADMMLT